MHRGWCLIGTLLGLLEPMEYASEDIDGVGHCPRCNYTREDGHWKDCSFGQLLGYLRLTDNKITLLNGTVDVKPCPYCGHTKMQLQYPDESIFFWVRCVNCQAEGPTGETDVVAVERWNEREYRRHQEDVRSG